MNRRDFLKAVGLLAPYQQLLLKRFLALEAPVVLGSLLSTASEVLAAGALTQVSELQHWSKPDYTRVAITLSEETRYASTRLPNRLCLDLAGARIGRGVKGLSVGDGLLKGVRIAQHDAKTVRIVLDLEDIKDYKIFTFSDPFRIIVDVKGVRQHELKTEHETHEQTPRDTDAAKPKQPVKNGKIRRIVVDPGHGGHDPGAVSQAGTREKDIVLQIGTLLAQKIRDDLGIETIMTRSTDVFIELHERTAFANRVGADLFVSVHANASVNHTANGIETYYLNLAKTAKVAELAAKENGTSLEKVTTLQAILFDLMANYKLNDSARLANEVQKSLWKSARQEYPTVKNLGVKQGPFYVLVGAAMPSILVETAFVDHERDEQKLKDPLYQQATADGIVNGIRGYISTLA